MLPMKEVGQTPLSQKSSKSTFSPYSSRRKTAGAKEIPVKGKDHHPEHRRLELHSELSSIIYVLFDSYLPSNRSWLNSSSPISRLKTQQFYNWQTVTHWCPIHCIWKECQVLLREGEEMRRAALTSVQELVSFESCWAGGYSTAIWPWWYPPSPSSTEVDGSSNITFLKSECVELHWTACNGDGIGTLLTSGYRSV